MQSNASELAGDTVRPCGCCLWGPLSLTPPQDCHVSERSGSHWAQLTATQHLGNGVL